jgi:hypothetical protein
LVRAKNLQRSKTPSLGLIVVSLFLSGSLGKGVAIRQLGICIRMDAIQMHVQLDKFSKPAQVGLNTFKAQEKELD